LERRSISGKFLQQKKTAKNINTTASFTAAAATAASTVFNS